MTIEQAINKAIEGGWEADDYLRARANLTGHLKPNGKAAVHSIEFVRLGRAIRGAFSAAADRKGVHGGRDKPFSLVKRLR